MLGLEFMCRENRCWEVPHVECGDCVRLRYDGCCKHVAVIGIGQLDLADQVLEAGDQGIADMRVHQTARTFQTFGGQIRSIAE